MAPTSTLARVALAILLTLNSQSVVAQKWSGVQRDPHYQICREAQRPPKARWDSCAQKSAGEAEPEGAVALRLATEGRFWEAGQAFRKAATTDSTDFDLHYNAGLMFEMAGRPAEAQSMFGHAAKLRDNDARVHWHLGVSWFNMGQMARAEQAFRRASAMRPTDASAWGYLAATVSRLNRDTEALVYWRRAVMLDSSHFARALPIERALYAKSERKVRANTTAPTGETVR